MLESTVLGRLWSRLLEIEFVDRAVALAAKAFVSFFPFLIIVAAVTPPAVRDEILAGIGDRFGISGDVAALARQAFRSPDETKQATGVIGAFITIAFAVSFTTALQRVYLRAWRRPPGGGARNKGRGALWIAGVASLVVILGFGRTVLVGSTGTVLSWAIGLIGSTGLWWWTAWLMLRGEIRWRALLPTAVVTGVGSWLYTLAASIWMPITVTKQFNQFGAFGIALAFVTWFTGLAFLIILAAVIAPALADGEDWIARWLRSGRPTALADHALPALPGPARPVRLSDAFGLGPERSSAPSHQPPAAALSRRSSRPAVVTGGRIGQARLRVPLRTPCPAGSRSWRTWCGRPRVLRAG